MKRVGDQEFTHIRWACMDYRYGNKDDYPRLGELWQIGHTMHGTLGMTLKTNTERFDL